MTRYTAPNQKVIRIHKDSYNGSYLTIGTEEWQEAFKSLKRITFGVYLYLSGNASGFELTLSRRDVMDRLGVSKDTYLRAVKELEERGYLAHKNGPVWNFYTTPVDMGTDAKEFDDDNENNESYESGNYESGNNESSESESSENVGGMVAYTQPSCMRTSNHNGSVEATDMVASTHTEINKYRETDNTDNVGSDEPPNTDCKNSYNENTDYKCEEESLREDILRETETIDIMAKEKNSKGESSKEKDSKEKETPREKNRWANDIDFLESLSEEDAHEMYDSFRTESRLDSNGLKRFLLDRYGVRVKDIRRFYDNLCLYCEE